VSALSSHCRCASCGPTGPTKGGSIVIRSRLLDYTGVFMLHCHMMNHEQTGMVQTVEVYKD
jgi:FtsP/CotA-like multicopper oxidase with cupredoxin domain